MEKIICNNCMGEFGSNDELQVFTDLSDNDVLHDVGYFSGCPECKTDEYLMTVDEPITYPATVGSIVDGHLTKDYLNDCLIYKDYKAFETKSDEVCYIPENSGFEDVEDTQLLENNLVYDYNDILEVAKGHIERFPQMTVEQLANHIFYGVTYETPETFVEGMDEDA